VQFVSVYRVFHSDFDFGEIIQDVELREVKTIVTIDKTRMFHDYQVQPSAASPPPSSRTILTADFLEMNADVLLAMES
jgi:hypothetical protein